LFIQKEIVRGGQFSYERRRSVDSPVLGGEAVLLATYLGIDLSTDPKQTAACWLTIGRAGRPRFTFELDRLDKDALVRLLAQPSFDKAAIDAPFGWPRAFRKQLNRWERNPTGFDPREALRLRETDRYVEAVLPGCHPQAVTASWLGGTAMYCCQILGEASGGRPVDRVNGTIVECYPLAGAWRFLGHQRRPTRDEMLDGLTRQVPGVREVTKACTASPHAFDALIAALVAWAAGRSQTELPQSPALKDAAAAEGWIHLPLGGSVLAYLTS
jgi:hypothetical protein